MWVRTGPIRATSSQGRGGQPPAPAPSPTPSILPKGTQCTSPRDVPVPGPPPAPTPVLRGDPVSLHPVFSGLEQVECHQQERDSNMPVLTPRVCCSCPESPKAHAHPLKTLYSGDETTVFVPAPEGCRGHRGTQWVWLSEQMAAGPPCGPPCPPASQEPSSPAVPQSCPELSPRPPPTSAHPQACSCLPPAPLPVPAVGTCTQPSSAWRPEKGA